MNKTITSLSLVVLMSAGFVSANQEDVKTEVKQAAKWGVISAVSGVTTVALDVFSKNKEAMVRTLNVQLRGKLNGLLAESLEMFDADQLYKSTNGAEGVKHSWVDEDGIYHLSDEYSRVCNGVTDAYEQLEVNSFAVASSTLLRWAAYAATTYALYKTAQAAYNAYQSHKKQKEAAQV